MSDYKKLTMRMGRFSWLFLITFLMIACQHREDTYNKQIVKADSLMRNQPDSALIILDSLEPFVQDFSRSRLRQWQLLRLMAQNKCDSVFRSDSLQIVLTDYYDHHGTSNERMMAHYLLGRAYCDMGETPRALKCYLDAAECADTTSFGCDWRQLSIVYLQAGDLFYRQYLPYEALAYYGEAERMAQKCEDKSLSLNASEQKILAYNELSDFSKVDSLTDYVFHGYDKMGETEKAMRSLTTSLYHHIKAGDTLKAKIQIDYLLTHIDSGKIRTSPEWAFINTLLGNYYLLIGEINSAESHFRTMLKNDDHLQIKVFAYKGLMEVYQAKGCSDSIYKYTKAYCNVNDSSNVFRYARQLEIINSLYQYDRIERNAALNEASSQRKTSIIIALLLISAALFISIFLFYKHKQTLSKRELVLNNIKYNDLSEMYHSLFNDMDALKAEKFDLASTLAEKEKHLVILEKQIEEYDAVVCRLTIGDPETSEVFKSLHKKAIRGEKATINELRSMRAIVSEKTSAFTEQLKKKDYLMSFKEENICYLIRYGFSASEISVLLDLSPQTLSYFKRKLLKKLFQTDGKASDINYYLCNL